ncbi:MAG TPA: M14 family metallopeptidase [Bacteroidales bacterium]|nr:M14 family metallopeptidase [Bacteroidales bacterium]
MNRKLLILFSVAIMILPMAFGQKLIITPYEKSEKTETMTYEEILRYSRLFDSVSNVIKYIPAGKTGNGYDIPLLICDASAQFDPIAAQKSGKAVLLIQAGVHAGEPDGTDAGMMLFRDIACRKIRPPENLIILFFPTINPEGCLRRSAFNRINQNGPKEMGWRTNAANKNLNRDYIKAETPEIQCFLEVFNTWKPDMFIDCHTTDGADYQYVVTYDLTDAGILNNEQNKWQTEKYLQPLLSLMEQKGLPMFRYVTFKQWHNPKSGLVRWIPSPLLSEGYAAVRNRPGLLIETHMLKPYSQRVDGTYEILKYTADLLDKQHAEIVAMNRKADTEVAGLAGYKTRIPVEFNSLGDSVIVDFKGVAYEVQKSSLTGGDWFQYSHTPENQKIWYFSNPKPVAFVSLPVAYVFEPAWKNVVELLDIHGIEYTITSEAKTFQVQAYRLTGARFSPEPYEGIQRLTSFSTDTLIFTKTFPTGSIIVPTATNRARLLAYMFEPASGASLVRWGFFNAVFEQKEYCESYVMEPLAREMLKDDKELNKEFQEKMKTDSEFAASQRAILNWFYQKTEYWDQTKDVVPVYRLNSLTLEPVKPNLELKR